MIHESWFSSWISKMLRADIEASLSQDLCLMISGWNLFWKLNDKVDEHDQSWGHQDDKNVSGYLQVAD